MTGYLFRRVLQVVPVVVVVSVCVFLLRVLIPGDPILVLAGDNASPEVVERLRRQFGLDQPLYLQYGRFAWSALQGDLGTSLRTRQPVIAEIGARLPATLQLTVASVLIAAGVGILLGTLAAIWRGRWQDNAILVGSLVGVSMPSFWLGLMLMLLFAVQLRWLPIGGAGELRHLILPAITLSAGSVALVTRLTRASVGETLRTEYVRTARAKGLPERLVVMRHALKNALIPTVTVIGLQFGALLGGAIITETIFAWPGVGRLMVDSIQARDFPVVQGSILLLSVGFVLVNLLVDTLYAFLDPRIRYGS